MSNENDKNLLEKKDSLVTKPAENMNMTTYIKNEASASLTSKSFSDYAGIGMNLSGENWGGVDAFVAGKATNSSLGGFLEGKYTTPKIADSNWSLESRTRLCTDKPYKADDLSIYMTQRVAGKGNWNLGKGVGIYEIAGVSSKISFQGKGVQSITPTSITGVSYKVSGKTSIYGEVEVTKPYSLAEKGWKPLGCGVYFGLKMTL